MAARQTSTAFTNATAEFGEGGSVRAVIADCPPKGPNWLDRRNISEAYEDRDPDVLVVGGGQAGLSIAARLTQLGVDTLVFVPGEAFRNIPPAALFDGEVLRGDL